MKAADTTWSEDPDQVQTGRVLIEQKSINKDLRAPVVQSDGQRLTPFQQAKRYSAELPYSQRPRWIVTCNFQEFLVYDMEQPNGEPESILLENLGKEYYRLKFLVDQKSEPETTTEAAGQTTDEERDQQERGNVTGK